MKDAINPLEVKAAAVTYGAYGIGCGVAIVLAQEYGFMDMDGKPPRPLTLKEV